MKQWFSFSKCENKSKMKLDTKITEVKIVQKGVENTSAITDYTKGR